MSFFDRGNALAVTPDGLRCQSREQREWHGCRATTGVKGKGKYYYEATVTDEGLCRVGWSTEKANLDIGTDRFSFGFGGTGKKSNNKQFDDYGETFGINDVIGCLIDFDKMEISFTKNGKNLGTAFTINNQLKNDTFYPAVVLKNAEMLFNFGETDFKHKIPEGYVAALRAESPNIRTNPYASQSAPSGDDLSGNSKAPQAIIIEPTKELAEQTFTQFEKFKKFLKDPPIRELLLIGGQSSKEQINELQRGVDIIVATPGRLEDCKQGIMIFKIILLNMNFFSSNQSRLRVTYSLSFLCTR